MFCRHALRISQLQNYWQKICEDEKRSQRRNEQLLRDLNRIDEHAARLAERTESLRNLKVGSVMSVFITVFCLLSKLVKIN